MKYYTREVIEMAVRAENPELPINIVRDWAKKIHSQLNTLDVYWTRSNRRFYRNNLLHGMD